MIMPGIIVNIHGIFPINIQKPSLTPAYGLLIDINPYSSYPYTVFTNAGILMCLYDQISLPKALTVGVNNLTHLSQ